MAPKDWKEGVIVPILYTVGMKVIASHRTITLLSNYAKIFKKTKKDKLESELN